MLKLNNSLRHLAHTSSKFAGVKSAKFGIDFHGQGFYLSRGCKVSLGANILYTFGAGPLRISWNIQHIFPFLGAFLYRLILKVEAATYIKFGDETGLYSHFHRASITGF